MKDLMSSVELPKRRVNGNGKVLVPNHGRAGGASRRRNTTILSGKVSRLKAAFSVLGREGSCVVVEARTVGTEISRRIRR